MKYTSKRWIRKQEFILKKYDLRVFIEQVWFSESIISSKVCIDPHTQRTKGYGFVSFSNKEAAMKAIESKNDAIVEGNRLRVRLKDKEYKKY